MKNNSKNFALIRLAGFITEKHLKETGNTLVAALDKHESVGFTDRYFPNCDFFLEYKRFDSHLYKLRRKDGKVYFDDLQTKTYENILNRNAFRITDAKKSIEIVHEIRNSSPISLKGEYHKFCKN